MFSSDDIYNNIYEIIQKMNKQIIIAKVSMYMFFAVATGTIMFLIYNMWISDNPSVIVAIIFSLLAISIGVVQYITTNKDDTNTKILNLLILNTYLLMNKNDNVSKEDKRLFADIINNSVKGSKNTKG